MLVVSKSPGWKKKKKTLTRIIFLNFYFIKMVNVNYLEKWIVLLLIVNYLILYENIFYDLWLLLQVDSTLHLGYKLLLQWRGLWIFRLLFVCDLKFLAFLFSI